MIDLDFIKRLNAKEADVLTVLASEVYWEFSNNNTMMAGSEIFKPSEITIKQTEKMLDDMLQFIYELQESGFVTDEKITEDLGVAHRNIHSLISSENVEFIKDYTNESLVIEKEAY